MEVSQISSLIEKIDESSLSENIRDLVKYSAMSQEHRKYWLNIDVCTSAIIKSYYIYF